jgi:peptide/nickel transport system substrate-binding protein
MRTPLLTNVLTRRGALASLVVAALLVSGCAPQQRDVEPEVFVYLGGAEPVINWDPSAASSNEVWVLNNVYETLTLYDHVTGELGGVLATSWERNADATEWIFRLRDGVKFHSGDPFDANAVKFTIDRTMEMGMGVSYIWAPVKEVQVLDRLTVKIITHYPAPVDIIVSAAYTAHMLNPRTADHEWFEAGNADGTGPYMVESWVPGDRVVLVRNPNYWRGWQDGQIEKVVFRMVPETTTRRLMLEAGDAHFGYNLPFDDVEALRAQPDLTVYTTPSQLNLIAYLNTQKPPLDDVRVRQAVSYAFPYQEVLDVVFRGNAVQSHGTIPAGMWAHSTDVRQYATDLPRAAELLRQAGWGPGTARPVRLEMVYTAGDEAQRMMAELFKANLAAIGVELDVRGVPWDMQWEQAKTGSVEQRQCIYVMYWWPDLAMPTGIRALGYTEAEPLFNLSYYSNPEFDRLVDEAERLAGADRERSRAKFTEAQNVLVDDATVIFVADILNVRVMDARFEGYVDNPFYSNVVFFYDLRVTNR